MTPEEIGTIVGAAGVGLLCGLIPLIMGLKRQQAVLAIIGFVLCIVAGLVLGILLAAPTAGIFAWIIVSQAKKKTKIEPKSHDL